ncbi:hypothetical protein OSH11_22415 [Kaistia dalseonensis]|uniref:Uncharacterized protein n=1 Tax=Kaistia dalseonensis TaxID=410840 RepID=A0ABU0HCR1_9HYPH|nr:hypothetical protein [Kaistia dalseonensis]MCX5497470.1 hypothetical protein [Kaistia dalseonensis]MDQ0440109.1 hypothetical protein [Kaistia dalseonensis]
MLLSRFRWWWSARLALASIFGLLVAAGGASAQQAIVGSRSAVVTGFSGFLQGPAPEGADPLDYLAIAPDGPSARIVDLSALGAFGTLSNAPKTFTATAAEVGQVFGVALDDAPAPTIYLAASSAYGLAIGTVDAGGAIKREHVGAVGARFLPGLFGPVEQGGGPGSIWRVDGTTGRISLFANISDASVSALGGLAFDGRSRQLFAADRASGLIHRFSLDGTDRGTFDHGTEGRAAAGLPPVPLSPIAINIEDPAFDTEQPASWGYADPERLIFGLAVHQERLYYAVAAGPEIWSIGIGADGAFAGDPRLEVEVPTLRSGIEIASIAFDGQGLLYAAERAPPTGAYDFKSLTEGGDSRVLRFRPKTRPDANPGLWVPEPDQYAIGLTPDLHNADGGVALGYGYDNQGRLRPDACAATVWSTGERLLGDGPGIDPIDGLQGNAIRLVVPANTPPMQSWFVDYDDRPGDPAFSGHMGALATVPCGPGLRTETPPPPPVMMPPPVVACPVGTMLINGACLLPPRCPSGTRFRDGYCVAVGCPPNMIRERGACVPPPRLCDRYETFVNGRCVPWACPRDMVRTPDGYCGCPRNEIYLRGRCVPPRPCPPDMVQTRDGRCLPPSCPESFIRDRAGRCIPPPRHCDRPFVQDNRGRCVCPSNMAMQNGRCVPPPQQCRRPLIRDDNGRCVCPSNQTMQNGRCVPPPRACNPPLIRDNKGRCVCPEGMNMTKGRCRPPVVIDCKPGFVERGGRCVPIVIEQPDRPVRPRCDQGERLVNGRCVPVAIDQPDRPVRPQCREGERLVRGQCVEVQVRPKPEPQACRKGFVMQNGRCVPIRIQEEQNDQPVRPNIQLQVPNPMKIMPQMREAPQQDQQ